MVTITDFGEVDFDQKDPDGAWELYCVAVCDKETDLVLFEERYANKSDYSAAINIDGRELMDEQTIIGDCEVSEDGGYNYLHACTYKIAFVIDDAQ